MSPNVSKWFQLGPKWSKMVQNGPNRSNKDKQTNKDKYKDQVVHGFYFCFFWISFACQKVPKCGKICQKVPKSAKQFPKVQKKTKGQRVPKKRVKKLNRLPENTGEKVP
mgnify:CR=1 FL=1